MYTSHQEGFVKRIMVNSQMAALETPCSCQFALSTQLIKPNYPVVPPYTDAAPLYLKKITPSHQKETNSASYYQTVK